MLVKVLSLTAAAIVAVHLGRQHRHRRKHRQPDLVSAPRSFHRESPTLVAPKTSHRNSQDDCFRVIVLIFLSISAFSGVAMFTGQLYTNNDLLQPFAIGILTLMTFLVILRVVSVSANEVEVELVKPKTDQVDLSGDWIRNPNESTSQEAVFELMKIGPLLRTAVRLVQGIQIQQTEDKFHFTVVSIIKFLKVTEVYSMSGEASRWQRRDLRRGRHQGFVKLSPELNSLILHLEWDAPFPGKGTDEFIRLSQTKLLVRSTLFADGRIASYDTIYDKNTD